jgi:membrane protein implicated in regulation of membrane protease activity
MDWLIDLYSAQPFWIWLAIGVALLAVEVTMTTEWLLWPAAAAGVVAVLTALGLPLGVAGELIVFALLTVVFTVLARRFITRINPTEADINDRDSRLVGQRAQVVQAFAEGRGRVFISGSEWAAEIDGEAPMVGQAVVVESVSGSRLKVRAV